MQPTTKFMLVVVAVIAAMVGFMALLTLIPDINFHMTWDDFWGAVILLAGFAILAGIVEGASS